MEKIRKTRLYVLVGLFALFTSFALYPNQVMASAMSADPLIDTYFKNFETLAKTENWKEIIRQGGIALEAAKKAHQLQAEAKICAQLTSTCFYLGDYKQALVYANRCHELSEEFTDPTLFIRALYLESAVYRALADKESEEAVQQSSYFRAILIAEEAACIYSKHQLNNSNLKGKIYFNLGAAHADNPRGDLEKAIDCYSIAIECFKNTNAIDDVIRTTIRLGKVYLLQQKYGLSQQAVDGARSLITKSQRRLTMHADYLEAQLKCAINDLENAMNIAKNGLEIAKDLDAAQDALRLRELLQTIEKKELEYPNK